MPDEDCVGCKHRHWVEPKPYATSNPGWGCLYTGGHATQRCSAYTLQEEPMPEEKPFHAKINDHVWSLGSAIEMIRPVAKALRTLGMEPAALQLFEALSIIDERRHEITADASNELDRQVKQAEQGSMNVLKAALAGAAVAKEARDG